MRIAFPESGIGARSPSRARKTAASSTRWRNFSAASANSVPARMRWYSCIPEPQPAAFVRIASTSPGNAARFFRARAEGREQIAVRDAARARGLAGEAAEAAVHVRQRVGEWERAFEHLLHQHDAAARRVHLLAQFAVGRAGAEAETTMHARLD